MCCVVLASHLWVMSSGVQIGASLAHTLFRGMGGCPCRVIPARACWLCFFMCKCIAAVCVGVLVLFLCRFLRFTSALTCIDVSVRIGIRCYRGGASRPASMPALTCYGIGVFCVFE